MKLKKVLWFITEFLPLGAQCYKGVLGLNVARTDRSDPIWAKEGYQSLQYIA